MSEKIIKCAKCQNNAETKNRWDEFNVNYPIRDKDGKIYCWDCYKGFSCCQGCGKSVANLKFPKSGNPYYPHAGGYSSQCERVMNEVNFLCSKKCAESIAAKKYQNWKGKLSQGWTKCEECWKTWSEWEEGGMSEWIKEEKNQWKLIKLAQPGQGKLCSYHKGWEEGGKQEYEKWYEEVKNQAQKHWNALSREERLKLVKRERPWGENYEEIVARPEIDAAVLRRFVEKASHEKHNCPSCRSKNYPNQEPMEGNNNFSGAASKNNSGNDNKVEKLEKQLIEAKKQGADKKEIERLQSELEKLSNHQQKEEIKPTKDNNNGLIWGLGVLVVIGLFLGTVILINKKKK